MVHHEGFVADHEVGSVDAIRVLAPARCVLEAESVGESRGLWLFWTHNLPAPVLQLEVRDAGRLIGRTDWGWPRLRGLGEFDGKVTYGRLLKPDQDPGEVVFLEKQREDRLREITGSWMIRLGWADLGQPARTAQRLRRLISAAS